MTGRNIIQSKQEHTAKEPVATLGSGAPIFPD